MRCATGPFAEFELDEEQWYELHIAGWLHDCGKVTTPVHMMDKSTKLETIYDRIKEVEMRFEVLRRDQKIAMLEASTGADADTKVKLQSEYEAELAELDDALEFLAVANVGGEFLSDEKMARIEETRDQWPHGTDGSHARGVAVSA